jgi:uncharacterized membrane protein
MTRRGLIGASVATVLALAVLAAVALGRLPAGATLPTHWNAAGEIDGRMPAATALFVGVAITAVVALVCALVPALEPDRARRDAGAPVLHAAWAGMLALMVVIEAKVAAPAFGWRLPALLPMMMVGVLLIVIGNVLPKSRPGFFVGIRTPWTLTDPENWIATHRFGARTMILGGLLVAAAAVLPLGADGRMALFVVAIVIAAVLPILYSFWYWRRHRAG